MWQKANKIVIANCYLHNCWKSLWVLAILCSCNIWPYIPWVSSPCWALWWPCPQCSSLHPQTCAGWEPTDPTGSSLLTSQTSPTHMHNHTPYMYVQPTPHQASQLINGSIHSLTGRVTYIAIILLTCVACMSCSQCLSLMAGFCSSPTALSEVTMFLTRESSPVNASHARISLSKERMS